MRGGVGSRRATKPHVLGHEAAGIIYKVGEEVESVEPGDHVALEPALPCHQCRYCREGQFK
jgi:D-xylulose reductase